LEEVKTALKDLQAGMGKQTFKFEDICPYSFDPSISSVPFPKHFEVPKFDNYKGTRDPRAHLQ